MAQQKFLARVKSLMPDAGHPAAQQPTPFGLNRYILLIIYLGYTFASTFVYLGWGPLSKMLFRSGQYAWLCTPEEQATAVASDSAICKAQDVTVQTLFTITYATHFCVSAVAGFITDLAGPRVTAMLGQALNICGWFILGACNDEFRAVLPAFLLIGAGAGMSYLPMLCIVHLFPGSTGFGLTIMGAACSLGFAVTTLLYAINEAGLAFRWVIWIYVLVGPIFSMALVDIFVPLSGFIEVDRFVLVRQGMSPVESPANRIGGNRRRVLSEQIPGSPYGSLSLRSPTSDDGALSSVTDDEFFVPFHKEACTFLYIGMCIYFMISSICLNYYQKASNLFLSADGLRSLNTALPLSVVPCIILGRLTDFVPIVWVMMLVNGAGSLSYLFAVVQGDAFSTQSVAFFSIYVALFSSQVYIFIINLFTSSHFGKLSGTVNMLGGLTSLISNTLYDTVTMNENSGNPVSVLWGLFGTVVSAFLVLIPMAFLAKRKMGVITARQVLREVNKISVSVLSRNSLSPFPLTDPRGEGNTPPRPQYDFTPQPPEGMGRVPSPVTPALERSGSHISDYSKVSVSLPGLP